MPVDVLREDLPDGSSNLPISTKSKLFWRRHWLSRRDDQCFCVWIESSFAWSEISAVVCRAFNPRYRPTINFLDLLLQTLLLVERFCLPDSVRFSVNIPFQEGIKENFKLVND